MSEKIVENLFCNACNAGVRKGALFCYHCGAAVAPSLPLETGKLNSEAQGNSEFNGNPKTEVNDTDSKKYVEVADKPIEKPSGVALEPVIEKKSEVKAKKVIVNEETKLKTAASLRENPRNLEKKQVEIIWEEPENSANVWFVVSSIVFVLFAVAILLAMLYIR